MCKSITISTSSKLPSHPAPSKRNHRRHHRQKQAWWQASVARRTASSLEENKSDDDDNVSFDVNNSNVMQSAECRFFDQFEENANTLHLHRDQIRINNEQPLGVGAFSEVYSVSINGDPLQKHNMVMKHLRSDLLSNRKRFHQAAADLLMETRILSRLDHPNIIKLRGYAAEGVTAFNDGSHDSYFILLEEVKMTLSDRIKQWKMEEEEMSSKPKRKTRPPVPHLQEKLRYATQIASALRYLHEHNIIYRDLKPDNIGITDDGTIKVLDFGLCRVLPDSQNSSEVFDLSGVGTRRYMSPEAVLKVGYNLKVDVFGFSMVMFELFTETKPYEYYNRQMHKQFACIEGVRPTIPDCWPNDLKDIVESAWDENPSSRPTSRDIYYQLKELMASNTAVGESSSSSSSVHNNIARLFRHPFAALLRSKKVCNNNSNNKGTEESSTAGSSVSV